MKELQKSNGFDTEVKSEEKIVSLTEEETLLLSGLYFKRVYYENIINEINKKLQEYISKFSQKYGQIVEVVDIERGLIKVIQQYANEDKQGTNQTDAE